MDNTGEIFRTSMEFMGLFSWGLDSYRTGVPAFRPLGDVPLDPGSSTRVKDKQERSSIEVLTLGTDWSWVNIAKPADKTDGSFFRDRWPMVAQCNPGRTIEKYDC